jgi:hypothetical protein
MVEAERNVRIEGDAARCCLRLDEVSYFVNHVVDAESHDRVVNLSGLDAAEIQHLRYETEEMCLAASNTIKSVALGVRDRAVQPDLDEFEVPSAAFRGVGNSCDIVRKKSVFA